MKLTNVPWFSVSYATIIVLFVFLAVLIGPNSTASQVRVSAIADRGDIVVYAMTGQTGQVIRRELRNRQEFVYWVRWEANNDPIMMYEFEIRSITPPGGRR